MAGSLSEDNAVASDRVGNDSPAQQLRDTLQPGSRAVHISPRLNMATIPSDVRVAIAAMVKVGLTPAPVTNTLPSPMKRLDTSCVAHQGLTTAVRGSFPMRQLPI